MNRRDLLAATIPATAGALMAIDPGVVRAGGTKSAAALANALLAGPYFTTHDGTTLFFKDWSLKRSENAEPVVFVHGWAFNSDMWQYQMIHLANRGLRCLAYDKRGHGRSSQPGYGYDYDTRADDLAVFLESLNLSKVTLVGHSIGCAEIIRYLSRQGSSRVARIVLIGTATPFALKTPDNPDGFERAVFEKMRAAVLKDFPKWLNENARPFFVPETSPEMVQWAIGLCLQASLKALIDCDIAGTETDFRPELPKITVPTLVIHGDADASEPIEQRGRRTSQLIPGSVLKRYEGAPHGLMFTHIDRLNADLLAFIRE